MFKKRIFSKVRPKNTQKVTTKKPEILNSLGNILLIAKFTGIFFFSPNKTPNKIETDDKWKTRIYSLIYFVIYSTVYILGFKLEKNSYNSETPFFDTVVKVFSVVFCVTTLTQVVVGRHVKSDVAKWFNSLTASDTRMEKIGLIPTNNHRKTLKKPFNCLIFIGLILFVTKMAIYQQAFEKPWIIVVCVALYHSIKSTFKMTLVFFMLHLYVRFEAINAALDEFASKNQPLSQNIPELTFSATNKLNSICKMHFRLGYLAKRLNDIAAFQFFYSFSVSLGVLLLFSFCLYHYIKDMTSNNLGFFSYKAILALSFLIIGLIDEIFDCLLITRSCWLLCRSANDTPNRLHQLRNKIQRTDLDEHIKANSLQFLHQKLSFTAQGYFNVNFAVLSSMFGTVLTYLVLFIQYDSPFRGKEVTLSHPV